MKLTDLNPHEKNPRLISDKKKNKLSETLEKYGDLSGVVFNLENQKLVGGHMRVETFKNAKTSIEYTEQRQQPDKQGTIAHGYIVIKGNKYAYREVLWEDNLAHEAAMIIANYAGGDWDDEKIGAWDKGWLEDEVGMEEWETKVEIDYSILDDEDTFSEQQAMVDNVKSAIQIEFKQEDFEKAKELVKEMRNRKFYIGRILILAMQNALENA